jgi:beta-galactosidase
MTTSERTLGFAEPVQMAKTAWFTDAYDGLNEAGYAYLISDTALPLDRWDRYKAVVVSSFEFMSAELQRKLVDFAAQGGTVVLGPRLPGLDERMRPDGTLKRAVESGASGLMLVSAPAEAIAALGDLDVVRFTRNDPRLDVAIHAPDHGGDRRVVFVANPTAETILAEVSVEPGVTWERELWHDRPAGGRKTLTEELPPYTISIYDCRA